MFLRVKPKNVIIFTRPNIARIFRRTLNRRKRNNARSFEYKERESVSRVSSHTERWYTLVSGRWSRVVSSFFRNSSLVEIKSYFPKHAPDFVQNDLDNPRNLPYFLRITLRITRQITRFPFLIPSPLLRTFNNETCRSISGIRRNY